MNLANKLTIFRVMLVPLMVIVPFFNITGEFLGIIRLNREGFYEAKKNAVA